MILFHAGRQATKVRLLWIASLLATAVMASAAAYFLLQMAGAADPALARGRLQLFLVFTAIMGVACVGVAIYVRCYVTRITLEDDGETVLITTMGLTREGTTRLDSFQVEDTGFHEGKTRTVDAPWWTVWLRGRLFPLVVDAQGEISDLDRLLEVFAQVSRK